MTISRLRTKTPSLVAQLSGSGRWAVTLPLQGAVGDGTVARTDPGALMRRGLAARAVLERQWEAGRRLLVLSGHAEKNPKTNAAQAMVASVRSSGRDGCVFDFSHDANFIAHFLRSLKEPQRVPTSVVISSHGSVNAAGQHQLHLGREKIQTRQFFETMAEHASQPLDVVVSTCFSGQALVDAHRLPAGSRVAAISAPGHVALHYDELRWAQNMGCVPALDAAHLLFRYCVPLKPGNEPAYSVGGRVYELKSMMMHCLGRDFPPDEKSQVHDVLTGQVDGRRVERVMKRMVEQGDRARVCKKNMKNLLPLLAKRVPPEQVEGLIEGMRRQGDFLGCDYGLALAIAGALHWRLGGALLKSQGKPLQRLEPVAPTLDVQAQINARCQALWGRFLNECFDRQHMLVPQVRALIEKTLHERDVEPGVDTTSLMGQLAIELDVPWPHVQAVMVEGLKDLKLMHQVPEKVCWQ